MSEQTLKPDEETLGWGFSSEPASQPMQPRLMVMHHTDLSRVGAMTAPDVLANGEWVTVGRKGPEFMAPQPGITSGALGDPYISRQQLRVRWRPHQLCFEVEPLGKRQVTVVNLSLGAPEPTFLPISQPTRLDPGALIAIGNRALLMLDVAPWHDASQPRLGMVGETEAIWHLRDEITQVSGMDRPVLILGPTGAGKELVARALHATSPRAAQTFLPVNCAALPEHLAESLLFGHEKGSFTGATAQRSGFFRDADSGTLFLDELGELSMGIQAKLLRVLQDHQVYPVGASTPNPVDTWLVAATNRDPELEISRGNLRSDFYFRIATLPVHVPPLKERRPDVPLLFVHFLTQRRERHPQLARLWGGGSSSGPSIPIAFVIDLMRRAWSGNIRELQNVVEQTVRQNLHDGPFVAPEPPTATGPVHPASPSRAPEASRAPEPPPAQAPAARATVPLDRKTQNEVARELGISRKMLMKLVPGDAAFDTDQELEALAVEVGDALERALLDLFVAHEFNQAQVAKHLGVARTTAIRLMQRFGIPRPQDLPPEVIEGAREEVGDDLKAMARHLGVSARALAFYMEQGVSE